jgi:hypothetical protein
MSPMTMTESLHNIEIPILANDYDEEFGEGFVASFVAHVNSLRHAQGLSDLCVGALSSPGSPNTIRVKTLSTLSKSGQALLDADNQAGRAHDSDQSKALHPDWRESSGIALPTVEELHYAHHFLIRAAERRLKQVFPASVPPPRKPSMPQPTCGCVYFREP